MAPCYYAFTDRQKTSDTWSGSGFRCAPASLRIGGVAHDLHAAGIACW
ncbi:hypothetical protein ACLK19_15165 [Escherichia coli]